MTEKKKLDIYDLEFVTNLEIAKNLVAEISNTRDKDICKKWISKLCTLKTQDVTVKKNRNSFFKYFLQVLHKGVQSDYAADLPQIDPGKKKDDKRDFMCRWSPDGRTYVAAKPIPGEGTLVYMAVTKDPSLGWDFHGPQNYIS